MFSEASLNLRSSTHDIIQQEEKTMRLTILIFIALCCLFLGCSSETDYSAFKERLDGGASCEELFNLRNSFDPSSPDLPRINEDLRGIGCYSSTSIRSSETPPSDDPEVSEPDSLERFTVNEYRIYRAIMDTPMSVSENQAFEKIAKSHGVSVDEVDAAAKKVQRILSQNNWFGQPESEIKHASDWDAAK